MHKLARWIAAAWLMAAGVALAMASPVEKLRAWGGARPEASAQHQPALRATRGDRGGLFSAEHEARLLPGAPLTDGITIGEPGTFDNLTVFAIYGAVHHDVGDVLSLHEALDKKVAEVREIGPGPDASNVSTLTFENKGRSPVGVLSGTVLGGGLQDRLVSRDFVLGPERQAALAVHCTEKNRWVPLRDGVNTHGRFQALDATAGTLIGATAEFLGSQSAVWERVQQVNTAHCKSSRTGALRASLDNPTIAKRRDALAREAMHHIMAVHDNDVLGLAYSVAGEVRSARIFANRDLFRKFSNGLVKGAAFDALTTAQTTTAQLEPRREALPQAQVADFIKAIRSNPMDSDGVPVVAGNARQQFTHARGFGAIALWSSSPDAQSHRPFTVSFVARPPRKRLERTAVCAYD